MSSIIVYSKPACVQCDATIKQLEKKGLDYTSIDISVDEEARQKVLDMGYTSAPVVVSGTDKWSGFRPDRISAINN